MFSFALQRSTWISYGVSRRAKSSRRLASVSVLNTLFPDIMLSLRMVCVYNNASKSFVQIPCASLCLCLPHLTCGSKIARYSVWMCSARRRKLGHGYFMWERWDGLQDRPVLSLCLSRHALGPGWRRGIFTMTHAKPHKPRIFFRTLPLRYPNCYKFDVFIKPS